MLLRDLQIVDGRSRFNSDLDCAAIPVVEHYLHHMGRRIRTAGTVKVIVTLVPVGEGARVADGGFDSLDVSQPFDFAAAELSDALARTRMILEALHAALCTAATASGWDAAPLREAYSGCLGESLVYRGWLPTPTVPHPTLPVRARLAFVFEGGMLHADVALIHGRREVGDRRRVLSVPVLYDTVRRLVSDARWCGRGSTRLKVTSGVALMDPTVTELRDLLDRVTVGVGSRAPSP